MKKVLLPAVLVIAAIAVWVMVKKNEPPVVPVSKATRQTLSNTLSTNGKVEPLEYIDVRVETAALVRRLLVRQGDGVRAGQTIAELSQPGLSEDLAAAEARVAQATAELETLRSGGRSADVSEIEGSVNRLRGQREAAQRALETSERLQRANAATSYEVEQAKQAVADIDVQIQSLGRRRSSLVGQGDLGAAQARLNEARANVRLAQTRIGQGAVRTSMGGIVYGLPARQGAYLNAGDLVASVGKLDPVRVRVYVDEPELGRVAPGETVRITWDALAGREWNGVVDKRPTEVIALGFRQVGEVLCTIANPNHELVPGTNVNAFILTQVVKDTITIPKTTVRRDNGVGVFVVTSDGTVQWRPIKTGVSDVLRVEVLSGVREGDLVVQPSDITLTEGMKVTTK